MLRDDVKDSSSLLSDERIYMWKKRDKFKWNYTEGSEDDDDTPKVPYRKLLNGRVSVLNE